MRPVRPLLGAVALGIPLSLASALPVPSPLPASALAGSPLASSPLLGSALLRPAFEPAPATAAMAQRDKKRLVGRYVRVELDGIGRILSLAEVEVVRDGVNVALRKAARQSTTSNEGVAVRAVDGDRDGVYERGSVTHTEAQEVPWWEVDLGAEIEVDQITIWNRTDCCDDRLEGLRVTLLDEDRAEVWATVGGPRPRPRRDFVLGDAQPVDIGPSPVARSRRQEAIHTAIDRGVEYLIELQQADGSWGHGEKAWGPGATGLVLYTLLKQGVSPEHQAVRRGFANLRGARPVKTYSVSTMLLALCALDDEQDMPLIESLIDLLLEWQGAAGEDGRMRAMWAYPGSFTDLSNTQFAALALRAAFHRGVKIPKDVWTGMLEATLEHAGEVVEVPELPTDGRSRSGPPKAAGFRYRTAGGHSFESGSMTTAGLSILAIAKEGLGGKIPGKWRRDAFKAEVNGMNWLATHFAASSNPGHGTSWLDYYLYGVERVGALYEADRFGVHDWYWEGAGDFLRRQTGGGDWGNEPNTCFALLFLSRATSATTGTKREARKDTWIAEGIDDEVRWRVLGDGDSVTMFVSGFSDILVSEAAFSDGPVQGLRIEKVRYFVDGEEIASIPADTGRGWNQERFPTRHRFGRPGKAIVTCEVDVLDPEAEEGESPTLTLRGRALEVFARRGLAGWMDEAARATADNQLRDSSFTVEASGFSSDSQTAPMATDGLMSTRWVCAADDAAPELTLDLDRPVRADVLLFYGPARHDRELGSFDHAERYEVWLDRDKEPREVIVPADPLEPARLELDRPESIRRIRVRIAERRPGGAWRGLTGLSEVAVLLGR